MHSNTAQAYMGEINAMPGSDQATKNSRKGNTAGQRAKGATAAYKAVVALGGDI